MEVDDQSSSSDGAGLTIKWSSISIGRLPSDVLVSSTTVPLERRLLTPTLIKQIILAEN